MKLFHCEFIASDCWPMDIGTGTTYVHTYLLHSVYTIENDNVADNFIPRKRNISFDSSL